MLQSCIKSWVEILSVLENFDRCSKNRLSDDRYAILGLCSACLNLRSLLRQFSNNELKKIKIC